MSTGSSGSNSQDEDVATSRRDENIRESDWQSVSCESVHDPEGGLCRRNRVSGETDSAHGLPRVAPLHCPPQLRRELTDVNDSCQVADDENHVGIRVLATNALMSELMTKLTHAATITGYA
jgi:hypothetical protein